MWFVSRGGQEVEMLETGKVCCRPAIYSLGHLTCEKVRKNSRVMAGTEVRPGVEAERGLPRGTSALIDITAKRATGYILHGADFGIMAAVSRTQQSFIW